MITSARSDGGTHQTMHLYLRDDLLESIGQEMFDDPTTISLQPIFGFTDPFIRVIVGEVRGLLRNPQFGSKAYVETLSRMLASWLLQKYNRGYRRRVKPAKRLSAKQFECTQTYIREHLDSNLTLAELASDLGVTMTNLIAEFKSRTGLTPYQFSVRKRIERAVELLISTPLSVLEMALKSGFYDQQHMTNVLKHRTGRTPGDIRSNRTDPTLV